MRTETYKKNDGSQGESKWLEVGDEIIILDNNPRYKKFAGASFPNYSVKVTFKGEELFIRLSGGQYKRLNNEELHPLTGKIFKAVQYTAEYTDEKGVARTKQAVGLDQVQ